MLRKGVRWLSQPHMMAFPSDSALCQGGNEETWPQHGLPRQPILSNARLALALQSAEQAGAGLLLRRGLRGGLTQRRCL